MTQNTVPEDMDTPHNVLICENYLHKSLELVKEERDGSLEEKIPCRKEKENTGKRPTRRS